MKNSLILSTILETWCWPYFFLKILTFPNSLSLRASTDVKTGQKFELEPGQNPIGA